MSDLETGWTAVFRTISNHISPGQVEKVRQSLREDIRRLWPEDGELAGGYRPNG
jgi:uncharacterized protein (DUF2267 family)